MSDFTYQLPFSNEKYMTGILYELKRNGKYDVAHLLKGATVSIETGGFSYYVGHWGRSDASAAFVNFYVHPQHIEQLENMDISEELRKICHKLIPDYVGFDVKNISFTMDLSKELDFEDDVLSDLEKQVDRISNSSISELLPEDIRVKGYKMAEVYTYLYSVENTLRLFIEKIGKENYGDNYFSQLNIPGKTRNTLSKRKEDSDLKKWLSIRGESELFYLDFKDLGSIINNNWDIFKEYFPNQDFILPKINEMADCRNLIAHNSIIDETEMNLIRTYYNVILKQLSETVK
ncbi:Swt1 family HEPN domain-containing protein [Sporosalibacterium faouarense]|uniref:Swt1 family HEPN domain-containing protein n=1 Tax=Sporosalibacterium faouarense TaxID=516123 RepID=UPI00192C2A00|nr:Swt1 family HEPN domain-containing protein [Sporosalibacterium faouarense]